MSSVPSADYVLGGGEAELTRLRAQAAEYEASARWLLDALGIQPGARVLDVGCGPIGILGLLSERVGPRGKVVGLEREPRFAQMAKQEVERLGLTNVVIVEADALNSGLERESFDLVHERLVMVNVPEREPLLSEMLALTAPGGAIALEDIDNVSWLCHPEHASWTTLLDAFHTIHRAGGGDPFIGRRLPALLRSAGVLDVQAHVQAELPEPGQYRRTHLISLVQSLRPKLIGMRVMEAEEPDSHIAALTSHLADPNTLVIEKLLVQAWGRKRQAQ
ncbi:MAG TPA: methyltransferase domain-containing protein [Candidatus Dormibacteraeota bacterium]|nr:methyltransferase domain-containing protein [Candidatus Dormibacteraeota bacterium]